MGVPYVFLWELWELWECSRMDEDGICIIILILLYIITLPLSLYPIISLSHKKIFMWEFSGFCGN